MACRLSMLPVAVLGAVFLAGSCGKSAPASDLLDAAALYSAREAAFRSIRAAYPGPYEMFRRIPARDPAEATKLDADFLSYLREDMPVEFIDFFPIGDSGKDEIDIVLWRYQRGGKWNTVSLVYFSEPMTFAEGPQDVRAFEACDEEARTWLEGRRGEGAAAAFCRINEHWHAYQRVE